MRRNVLLVATMALTLLVASGLALVAGVGSAAAESSVVGPGESIQKAINAAHSGDTIVVKGVHREDVVIRKDGIKLRGEDAVIEAPSGAKADSPCSRAFGTEAICVYGDTNETGELTGPRVKDVSVSGFTIRGFNMAGKGGNQTFAIDFYAARNATVVGNRVVGNVAGGIAVGKSVDSTVAKNHVIGSPETEAGGIHIANGDRNTTVVKNVLRSIPEGVSALEVEDNSIDTTVAGNDLVDTWLGVYVENTPGTKILSNDVSRAGFAGMFMFGPKQANNATVLANHVSGADFGFLVANSHGGSFAANELYNNCAGVVFISTFGGPVGDY
jgi:nitrous oxidase accessory protein NosD